MRTTSPSTTTQGSKTASPSQGSEAASTSDPARNPSDSCGAARKMERGPNASQKISFAGKSSGGSGGMSARAAAA
ncbi:MAG: hypothetical protein M5U28_44775 [Sandaracinaceae bacterium]|nr:hypothetical protein [Sandaracinaceae bacterium]